MVRERRRPRALHLGPSVAGDRREPLLEPRARSRDDDGPAGREPAPHRTTMTTATRPRGPHRLATSMGNLAVPAVIVLGTAWWGRLAAAVSVWTAMMTSGTTAATVAVQLDVPEWTAAGHMGSGAVLAAVLATALAALVAWLSPGDAPQPTSAPLPADAPRLALGEPRGPGPGRVRRVGGAHERRDGRNGRGAALGRGHRGAAHGRAPLRRDGRRRADRGRSARDARGPIARRRVSAAPFERLRPHPGPTIAAVSRSGRLKAFGPSLTHGDRP